MCDVEQRIAKVTCRTACSTTAGTTVDVILCVIMISCVYEIVPVLLKIWSSKVEAPNLALRPVLAWF